MSNTLIVVILIAVLVGAGFLLFTKGGTNYSMSSPQTQQTSNQTGQSKEIEVAINTQNGSNELGNALLVESNGKVVVKVYLKGQATGASQPAHIHLGFCSNLGTIKYPLTSVVNGTSETTIDTTLAQLKALGPLAINVHKSDAQMQAYVACGDIKF